MEFKKLFAILAALLVLALPAQAAQVKFKTVSVHDPSVMRGEDGRWYIYGSHMQAAWSDDLQDWKMFSKLDKCALQPNYAKEFAEALKWADTCVLVLPCGRSAHTEAGWMAGARKRVIAYIPEMVEPELMYKLFDQVVGNLDDLVKCFEYDGKKRDLN